MAAHERVMRGDDLTNDPYAMKLPDVLDLPWSLQPWEPSYALAEYEPDRMEAPTPKLPALGLLGAVPQGSELTFRGASPLSRGEADAVASSLVDLVSTWTEESDGRAEAIGVRGDALRAIEALGARPREIVELDPAMALAAMGWAAASGGSSVRHSSSARLQRAANRQPAGGLTSDGGRPGMPVSVTWSCRTPTSGSEAISAWV